MSDQLAKLADECYSAFGDSEAAAAWLTMALQGNRTLAESVARAALAAARRRARREAKKRR